MDKKELEAKLKKWKIPSEKHVHEKISIDYSSINESISVFKERLDKFLSKNNAQDGTIEIHHHAGYDEAYCDAEILLSTIIQLDEASLIQEITKRELKAQRNKATREKRLVKAKEKEELLKQQKEKEEHALYQLLKNKFEGNNS